MCFSFYTQHILQITQFLTFKFPINNSFIETKKDIFLCCSFPLKWKDKHLNFGTYHRHYFLGSIFHTPTLPTPKKWLSILGNVGRWMKQPSNGVICLSVISAMSTSIFRSRTMVRHSNTKFSEVMRTTKCASQQEDSCLLSLSTKFTHDNINAKHFLSHKNIS